MTDTEPKQEGPPPLSEEYHRARRNLNLVSGLFFAWEFVGIDLAKPEQEAAGVHFVIKSPGAVPWVLLVLVLFFAVRLWFEWVQCDATRRRVRAARMDLQLSVALALLSLAVFSYQQATHGQLFSAREVLWSFGLGGLVSKAGYIFLRAFVRPWTKRFSLRALMAVAPCVLGYLLVPWAVRHGAVSVPWAVGGLFGGAVDWLLLAVAETWATSMEQRRRDLPA